MSRDSGAGAYSHGIACPSPRPQLLGACDRIGRPNRPGWGSSGRPRSARSVLIVGHYGTGHPPARSWPAVTTRVRVVAFGCPHGWTARWSASPARRAPRRPARRPGARWPATCATSPDQPAARRRPSLERGAPSQRRSGGRPRRTDPARRRDRRRRHPAGAAGRRATRRRPLPSPRIDSRAEVIAAAADRRDPAVGAR